MTLTEAAKLVMDERAEWTVTVDSGIEPFDPVDVENPVMVEAAKRLAAHVLDDGPDSLADHKQRLAAQSARLAAAESEVRRLRRVIDAAPAYWGARSAGRLWLCVNESGAKEFGSGPVKCKLVPMDELEASDAD